MENTNDFDFQPAAGSGRLVEGINFEQFLRNGEAYFEIAPAIDEPEADVLGENDPKNRKTPKSINDHKQFSFQPMQAQFTDEDFNMNGTVDFDELRSTMKDIELSDGSLPSNAIVYKVVRPGHGESVQVGDLVWVHYRVFVEGQDETVDSSFSRQKPHNFTVGMEEVIPFLDIGVRNMSTGEIKLLIVQTDYAYGKLGCMPRIPPEATILVEMELTRFHHGDLMGSIEHMTTEERQQLDFSVIFDAAERKKILGNEAVNSQDYNTALVEYRRAMKYTFELLPVTSEENSKMNKMIYVLNINRAKCYLDMKSYSKAIEFCKEALACPIPALQKIKAHFRLATGLYEIGKYEEARVHAGKANCLNGSNDEIRDLCMEISKKLVVNKKIEKEMAKKIFS